MVKGINWKELAEMLTATGIFLTGLASLITSVRKESKKKEQPKPRRRPRKLR